MRCSPQAGVQCTCRMSRSACARRPVLVHADEPLRRGAEDQRALVTPAVWIAVAQRCLAQQQPIVGQPLHDHAVGLIDLERADQRRRRLEAPVRTDRVDDRQPVAHADLVVLLAMRGRRMHGSGPGLERHVLTQDHRHGARQPRMLQPQALQRTARELAQQLTRGQAVAREAAVDQIGRDHQHLRAGRIRARRIRRPYFHAGVAEMVAHRDRFVRRQGPRCRGPDHDRDRPREPRRLDARAAREIRAVHDAERNVHRGRGPLLVLDFRFGQRGAAVQAPVHRLRTPVQVSVVDHLAECANLLRLVARIHRQVRVLPVAEDTEAPEIPALGLDLCGGEGAAGSPERRGVELVPRLAVLLLDRELDRQAMAVPARHVRGIEAIECTRLDDDVLQDLVDRVAEMDHPVGIRRTVVQHERPAPDGDFAHALIEALVGPALQLPGLARCEIRLHRELGLRQVYRLLVVTDRCRPARRLRGAHAPSTARASAASRRICCTIASIDSNLCSARRRATNCTSSS